jgi:hypothetical protein
MRLGLYRRIVSMADRREIDAITEIAAERA